MDKNTEKIIIGKIVNAAGLKGEVKIYAYSDRKERFEELDGITLSGRGKDAEYKIENVRYQKNLVVAKLAGVDDRNGAEALKNYAVCISAEDLAELPEDTFYIKDLIGCRAVEEESGRPLGVVADVLQNSAQDIYVLEADGQQILIPAVEQFIRCVDIAGKTVTIRTIPGLIPEERS